MEILTTVVLYLYNKLILSKSIKGDTEIKRTGIFPVIKESSVFFMNNFLRASVFQINTIVLKFFTSLNSVAVLSSGLRFVNGFGLISGGIYNAFYPYINSLRSDMKAAYKLTFKLTILAFISGSVISVLIFLFSDILIDLTFKIEEGKSVLKILSFTIVPIFIYTISSSFLIAVYKEKFLLKSFVILGVLNLVLNTSLIYFYNYTGCAFAILISEFLVMIVLLFKFLYEYKIFNESLNEAI